MSITEQNLINREYTQMNANKIPYLRELSFVRG